MSVDTWCWWLPIIGELKGLVGTFYDQLNGLKIVDRWHLVLVASDYWRNWWSTGHVLWNIGLIYVHFYNLPHLLHHPHPCFRHLCAIIWFLRAGKHWRYVRLLYRNPTVTCSIHGTSLLTVCGKGCVHLSLFRPHDSGTSCATPFFGWIRGRYDDVHTQGENTLTYIR